ncbi:MBOAT family O-acyltransferase [Legionella cardiaca]|uniref:Probable alginate O-acetylase n=1 Tax=Legionella cardiaca TaxID=1071983 RepID=A0ABY8ARL4_9GAMM|nr:MBOAT family O-acyltransferase [Legionella cardiaca]WED41916.1 MBOAT family protein [Legionella cardiaca]
MLFNSYSFLFCFLPFTFAAFYLLQYYYSSTVVIAYLFVASLLFYSYWNTVYLPFLLLSITFNYVISSHLERHKSFLYLGIIINVAILIYFKYSQFILANVHYLLNIPFQTTEFDLPLGISFFTFTQIAFLVDRYRQEVPKPALTDYGLFVTFFPHLMAGPILHHKEIMPQFKVRKAGLFKWSNLAVGLSWFSIGLFKKAILADSLSPFVTKIFLAAETGNISFIEAWAGSLAYTFQLYFDFSGYSDMAIGLAAIFGITFPLNFNSPYKAVNLIDFWRRWHMTLSRFLRDYIYIPLGGNRRGTSRRYINLVVTMLIGGIWHGASWTFILWGFLHGIYLLVNHAWLSLKANFVTPLFKNSWLSKLSAKLVTFIAVIIGWVFFRASSFTTAKNILRTMFNIKLITTRSTNVVSDLSYLLLLLLVSGCIVFFAPNTQEFLHRFGPLNDTSSRATSQRSLFSWRPNAFFAFFCAILTVISLLTFGHVSEFLYYKF